VEIRAKAERQARPLLEQHGHHIEPAGTPIKTLAGLTAYASAHGIELTPKPNQRVINLRALCAP